MKSQLLWPLLHCLATTSWLGAVVASTAAAGPWHANCPARCVCDRLASLRTTDCSRIQLQRVPRPLPPTTQNLILSKNRIKQLRNELAPLAVLQKLDLSGNQLTEISNCSFGGNGTTLRTLNLAANKLQRLQGAPFQRLLQLDQLVLTGNLLKNLTEKNLAGLSQLRSLDLSRNALRDMPPLRHLAALQTLIVDSNALSGPLATTQLQLQQLTKLSLKRNALTAVSAQSLAGCDKIQTLALDYNHMATVPVAAISALPWLRTLSLSGNPVPSLESRSFSDLARIMRISLNNMPKLARVDAEAFLRLPKLLTIDMHHNSRLIYLDPRAFLQLPLLEQLLLNDNALLAIPSDIIKLPVINDVTIANNDVICDCNAHWLADYIAARRRIPLLDAAKIRCGSPAKYRQTALKSVPPAELPATCAPKCVTFYNTSYHVALGSALTLECRAIGVPQPSVQWRLPNGKTLTNISNYSRLRMRNPGTLTLLHIKATDAGKYACVCASRGGVERATTRLNVFSSGVHVIPHGVSANFITVTWNGTSGTTQSTQYVILYRRQHDQKPFAKIPIRPFMRMYTVTGLRPESHYEFCMTYQRRSGEYIKLNCLQIRTKHKEYLVEGIHRYPSFAVLMSFSATVSFFIVFCFTAAIVRKYTKRKTYKQAEGYSIENCTYKYDGISNIPLDNLYRPCSTAISQKTTPVYASKTTIAAYENEACSTSASKTSLISANDS